MPDFLMNGIWVALGFLNSAWPYLVMILGFSLIVFVHELGHFAVAKWARVRVEKFAIGFGREIFGVTRGETRYSFNVLPFGGYVKMLGQEDFDDKTNELRFREDPRSFANKSVGARMAIVSAGVIMNVLFACLLFMIVFMMGMQTVAPRIATVEPDSPAEKAGLLPGDIVKEINGEPVLEFPEVQFAILLSPPHEMIEFVVERNGKKESVFVEPESRQPASARDVQRQLVGISSGKTREIVAVGPEIDAKKPSSPRPGDKLVEVGGVPVTDANVSEVFGSMAYTEGDALVERPDPMNPDKTERVPVKIPPILSVYPSDPADPDSISVLGLTPLARVDSIDPRGRAYLAGLEVGDTILVWDDKLVPTPADVLRSIRDRAERDIYFRVRRGNGSSSEGGFMRPKVNARGPATIQAVCEDAHIDANGGGNDKPGARREARFAEVRPDGAAARANVENGDVILSAGENDRPICTAFERMVRSSAGKPLPIVLKKADGRTVRTVVEPQAPGSLDVRFSVSDDLLRTGEVVKTLNGEPSPASKAGIPAGALIKAVGGVEVARWRDLIREFQKNAGKTIDLTYKLGNAEPHTASFQVPHCVRTALGLGPAARIIRIDGREHVMATDDSGQQKKLSVRYHEGTRSILRELVGRTAVPVEYRESPLAELKTDSIDVTADMVDPWLGRVVYAPNIMLGEEMVLLRGANPLEAIRIGAHKTWYFIRNVYVVMKRMFFSRTVGFESVSGPLGIIDMGGQVARAGVVRFLFFLAIISANLAVINFLPLPIVDGGLMVFLIIEKIKGSPVSLRVQVATQMMGLVLIIGTFLFVTYQDVIRLFG